MLAANRPDELGDAAGPIISAEGPTNSLSDPQPISTQELHDPEPIPTQDGHTASPGSPLKDSGLAEPAEEELRRAAAILLKHSSIVCEGLCSGCVPVLQKMLSRLALFDPVETTTNQSETEDDNGTHSENHSEVDDEPEDSTPSSNMNDKEHVTSSVAPPRDLTENGSENGSEIVDDSVSSGETPVNVSQPAGAAGKARPWHEEQSSGSEVDEEVPSPLEDQREGEIEASQSVQSVPAAHEPADLKIPKATPERMRSISDNGRDLAFHSPNAISNYAWANVALASPKLDGDEESILTCTPEQSGKGEIDSPSASARKTRLEQEARRMAAVVRKKDFECFERIRGGPANVVEGLELHKKVFNNVEQQKLIDMVYKYQEMGREGKLRGRTYSEPKKWMPGKGRVTIQFGCCYNYAIDKNGNPPGITDELVDPLPDLLKTTIRRLVRWGVLQEKVVPDSCIINIYDVGDCIPPHIDHHDFVRPFSTLSLLSECNIVFGSRLSIVGDGQFDGPMSLPLPTGSVLVLKGNAADLAKHAVPGVPTRRISITFRKMDPSKAPSWYVLPNDLKGIRTAPHLR